MQPEFDSLGFDKCLFVKDRRSIADSFTKNNRCGIYILHFSNHEYYVGLAIDVVNRYAQHRLNHLDIEYISFKETPQAKLSQIEKQTVYELEHLKKPLRNISLVSLIKGETDFDLIVSPKEQKQWLNYELDINSLKTTRFDYPDLRKKNSPKFNQLKQTKYFDAICEMLQNYILFALPFPCRTEYSFWSCSCLPTGKFKTFSRINIFWQEVLTIYEDEFYFFENGLKKLDKVLAVSLHVCKSELFKIYNIEQLKKKFPTIGFTDHFYEPGGQDQQNIYMDVLDFYNFINDPLSLNSIKEFNLRLMRKGACIYNRYHCFVLADQALRTDNLKIFEDGSISVE